MAGKYRRKSGIWYLKWYVNGRPRYKSLKTKDRAIANVKKRDFENQLERGASNLPNTNASAYAVLEEYIGEAEKRNAAKTVKDDKARLKAFLETTNPGTIGKITEGMVLKYLGQLSCSVTTVNHTLKNLKTWLNFAVKRGYLTESPLRHVQRYRQEKKLPRFLSEAEIKAVFEAAKTCRLWPLIPAAVYTGMRLGELKALRWGDIDFKTNTIIVQRSKGGKCRSIPLHPKLAEILIPGPVTKRVFDMTDFRNRLDDLREATKLSFRFHDLRHTFASHLIMSGADILVVSRMLGHSSLAVTNIYSHINASHMQDSIKKLTI